MHCLIYNRIMKDRNILCRIRKSYCRTTNSDHSLTRYPNLIKNIVAEKIDRTWHADITYIRLETSFAYLAAIIDGLSRKVIGYAIVKTLSSSLTITALKDAIGQRNIDGLIHHSDQGYVPPEEFEYKFNKNKTHQLVLT